MGDRKIVFPLPPKTKSLLNFEKITLYYLSQFLDSQWLANLFLNNFSF